MGGFNDVILQSGSLRGHAISLQGQAHCHCGVRFHRGDESSIIQPNPSAAAATTTNRRRAVASFGDHWPVASLCDHQKTWIQDLMELPFRAVTISVETSAKIAVLREDMDSLEERYFSLQKIRFATQCVMFPESIEALLTARSSRSFCELLGSIVRHGLSGS